MSKNVLKLTVNRSQFEKRYAELRESLYKDDQKTKVYIDTNIFGRAIDGKMKPEQASSLRRVMSRQDELDLYTSNKTRKEISDHPNQAIQDYLQFVVSLASVIPEENFVSFEGGSLGSLSLGSAPLGGGVEKEDPIYTQISAIFDGDDAEHVFQAVKSKANYFLTLDNKTILSRRNEFNKLGFETKLVSPTNLESIMFAVEDNTN